MVASAFLIYPQANKLLIYSQRGSSNKTLVHVLANGVFPTFTSLLEGVLEIASLGHIESLRVVEIYFALIFYYFN